MNVLSIILIVVNILLTIILNFYFTKILRNELISSKREKEEEIQILKFKPYLAFCEKECEIFDDNGNKVGNLNDNTFVTVVFEKENRSKLLNGKWVNTENITKDFNKISLSQLAEVKETTRVLNGPSIGYQTICNLPAGATVIVKGIYGAFAEVIIFDQITGYILKNILVPKE